MLLVLRTLRALRVFLSHGYGVVDPSTFRHHLSLSLRASAAAPVSFRSPPSDPLVTAPVLHYLLSATTALRCSLGGRSKVPSRFAHSPIRSPSSALHLRVRFRS